MSEPTYESACCAAPAMVAGAGLTHWYACEGCHLPCTVVDQLVPHEPFSIEEAEAA